MEKLLDKIRRKLKQRNRVVLNDSNLSRAAVVVPLFEKDSQCHILLTKRTMKVKHHKGEVSFPGGMADDDDKNLKKTALRELYEEVGIKEEDIDILGVLDDIVTMSDFIVTPFVGYFPYPYPFKISKDEVDELIELPLSVLLDKDKLTKKMMGYRSKVGLVYIYEYNNHQIWGATAKILKQFIDLIYCKLS